MSKFLAHKDIVSKLNAVGFKINLIWTRSSKRITKYQNQGDKIKTKAKSQIRY